MYAMHDTLSRTAMSRLHSSMIVAVHDACGRPPHSAPMCLCFDLR